MPERRAPRAERLTALIETLNDEEVTLCLEDQQDIANALDFLRDFLLNRRGYQRKSMIKKKLLLRYAKENGIEDEINDAANTMMGEMYDDED